MSKQVEKSVLAAVLLFSLLCSGCGPLAIVGAGATVGTAAAEERGLEGIASDTRIRSDINYLWITEAPNLIDQVGLSVQAGCVVLTGFVESAHLKAEAVRLVRQVKGVTAVYDEMHIGPEESWSDYARDAWITTKLKTTLLADENIRSRNYSLRTVDKVIYLTGIAQDQQELNLVMAHARDTPNVRRVVNHVQLKQNVKNLPETDGGESVSASTSPPSSQSYTNASQPPIPSSGRIHQAPATPLFSTTPGRGGSRIAEGP